MISVTAAASVGAAEVTAKLSTTPRPYVIRTLDNAHGSQRSPAAVITSSWVKPRGDCSARNRIA